MTRAPSVLLVLPAALALGCSSSWVHPAFSTYAAGHERIAVAPFDYTSDLQRLPRDRSAAEVAAQDVETGEVIQAAVIGTLRNQQDRVAVQGPEATREVLDEADIDDGDPSALAEALGVDAVLVGTVVNTQYLGDGAAITVEVISEATGHAGHTPTDEVEVELALYDGDTGALLWTCEDFATLEVTWRPRVQARTMSRGCVETLPYIAH